MPVSAAALAPRYGELEKPVVILADSDDRVVDFAGQSLHLSGTLRNAVLVRFSGVGHMLHHVIPDEVVAGVDLVVRLSTAPSEMTAPALAISRARADAAEMPAGGPAGS